MKEQKNAPLPGAMRLPLSKIIFWRGIRGEGYFSGSILFFCHGWQRKTLFMERKNPLVAPYFCIASFEYSEQVG